MIAFWNGRLMSVVVQDLQDEDLDNSNICDIRNGL